MADKHDYSFFGQKTGLILSSSSRSQPHFFFKCVKKKPDDSWEKLKSGEGKTVKISLEEMAMIKSVLEGRLKEWSTFHKREEITTTISFKWDDVKLIVAVGDYFKPLAGAQVEIMKYLIAHLFEEKIAHATTLPSPAMTEKEGQESPDQKRSSRTRGEEVRVEGKNAQLKIKGVMTGETDKAVMIQFRGGKESWIPKSTIHSEYDGGRLAEQEFLIDEWVLKKNDLILSKA